MAQQYQLQLYLALVLLLCFVLGLGLVLFCFFFRLYSSLPFSSLSYIQTACFLMSGIIHASLSLQSI
ncbi:hypothetical protein D3C79_974690 [compost metagenome]